jgi:GNAT superfamily N-acetyltransferase
MTTLRHFAPADAAACCRLINEAIETMDGLNAPARALIISKNGPEAVGADLGRCFSLVAIGAAGLEGLGVLDGSEVRRVYVDPRLQRRGIGTMIVRALEAEARKRGLPRLELQASPSSVPFYLSLGFRTLQTETTRNGDAQFIHVRMHKDLD